MNTGAPSPQALPAFATELVEWLRGTHPAADPLALASAGLVAARAAEGHVCVDLTNEIATDTGWPALPAWRTLLFDSGFVSEADGAAPLQLDGTRLYLTQLWRDERAVAAALRARAGPTAWRPDQVKGVLASRYAAHTDREQKQAAACALLNRICLIAGGPGTGKTTTVARVLAALIALAPTCRIVLAAPTGRAAARMSEAMNTARESLALDMLTQTAMPGEAQTLHRLLGYRPDSATPQHGPEQHLPLDVLVVDEASMIDLSLFARLLAALPPAAHLVLLGDPDQLPPVEAGSVFADLVPLAGHTEAGAARLAAVSSLRIAATPGAIALSDGIAQLRTSHRFDVAGGVGRLAAQLRQGEAAAAIELLGQAHDDLHWRAGLARQWLPTFCSELTQHLRDYRAAIAARDIAAAWQAWRTLCVLSPLREGPVGVEQINRLIEVQIFGQSPDRRPFYAGRPVIVRSNDATLRLANGDVGLTLAHDDGLRVYFADGAGWRSYAPTRLPRHDSAFALTVHQAQGSEFDAVWLLLPDQASPMLDRSLLYTAVTRARKSVTLWGPALSLQNAIVQKSHRDGGLASRLQAE